MIGLLRKKPKVNVHFNDGPCVELIGECDPHMVYMSAEGEIVHQDEISGNCWTRANRRFHTPWQVSVVNKKGRTIFSHQFDLKKKSVRINIDSRSLGDTLAWIPQIESFANQQNQSKVFVSHFWPSLFDANDYPGLTFLPPEDNLEDCYATYNIGYFFENTSWYHPVDPRKQPLPKVAADILGVNYVETPPKLSDSGCDASVKSPYVCIATASTAACKHWRVENGWQTLVDFLEENGLQTMVIQKEPTSLTNVIDETGDQPIANRIGQLRDAIFFVGLGSGLSWLAWAMEKPVVLISGFSEPYTEFQRKCHRVINTEFCHGCWNDTSYRFDRDDWNWCPRHKGSPRHLECSYSITIEMVKDAVKKILPIE